MDDRGDRGERRVGSSELSRTVNRIDKRTERIEIALFDGTGPRDPGLMTRVLLLERAQLDSESERKLARIFAAIATLIGSAIGAAAAIFGVHTGAKP